MAGAKARSLAAAAQSLRPFRPQLEFSREWLRDVSAPRQFHANPGYWFGSKRQIRQSSAEGDSSGLSSAAFRDGHCRWRSRAGFRPGRVSLGILRPTGGATWMTWLSP